MLQHPSMKKTFLLILFFNSLFCSGQNWQCLQGGMKHYFINGNGYLRGIRIDSVIATGDTTIYYPNHTPRGPYSLSGGTLSLDSNGGSWLGKKVLQKSDGTFIFDSYWNDSVIIKTHSNIGDSWIFYKDSGSRYYTATLIAIDTMTVLSSPDSVQKIRINAYDTTGIVTSDPLDSFTIVLSKNNGFVQVFDLYTFPYHKPDSVYRAGLDFFLDRSTHTYSDVNSTFSSSPNSNITLFQLIDFINPNDQQLHNWNVGDVFESNHSGSNSLTWESFTNYILNTVSTKIVSGDVVNYTLSGTHYTYLSEPSICSLETFADPCFLITDSGSYNFNDTVYSIADTLLMPEENLHIPNYIFYFPDDTSQCLTSPAYVLVFADYPLSGFGGSPVYYKLGIGEISNEYFFSDLCILYFSNKLTYTNIGGVACGTFEWPVNVNNIQTSPSTLDIFPNPTTSQITITSSDKIFSIAVTNLVGQTVYTNSYEAGRVDIDISQLPAGVYFIKINGTEVRKFVKE